MLLNIIIMTYYTHICCYIYRKAVLPIEAELGNSKTSESESDDGACISQYVVKMNEFRDKLFSEAKRNIDDAQLRQKRDYDRKHAISKRKVSVCSVSELPGLT